MFLACGKVWSFCSTRVKKEAVRGLALLIISARPPANLSPNNLGSFHGLELHTLQFIALISTPKHREICWLFFLTNDKLWSKFFLRKHLPTKKSFADLHPSREQRPNFWLIKVTLDNGFYLMYKFPMLYFVLAELTSYKFTFKDAWDVNSPLFAMIPTKYLKRRMKTRFEGIFKITPWFIHR